MLNVRFGSKREELNVSKSGPLCPIERTSMRRAATSLMGTPTDFVRCIKRRLGREAAAEPLYTVNLTIYVSTTGQQTLMLELPMKQRLPKSPLIVVAAARMPSEGAIII
jgi:hypothetical protein